MQAAEISACLWEKGYHFYTGVPDSLLSPFCDYLIDTYGVEGPNHYIANNEGGCVALASGYHLATGKVPCVYMQNSGIGNMVNPVTSLTHTDIYGIPMLFIIGWRGEPGVHDEPQHIFQGKSTLQQLEVLDIPYFVVGRSTTNRELADTLNNFSQQHRSGRSCALVVRKSGIERTANKDYHNQFTLNRESVIDAILTHGKGNVFVSTTGKISRELFELREKRGETHETDFLTVGSMGHSVMIALGIALNQSARRIWCIDGDGAALMHMGCMGIVGKAAPQNLIHIVLNNCAHDTVGGMPTASDTVQLTQVARACNYTAAHRVTKLEELQSLLAQCDNCRGPLFIEICVALGSRSDLGRPTVTTTQNKQAFMSFLRGENL